jgi:hypothetical protein
MREQAQRVTNNVRFSKNPNSTSYLTIHHNNSYWQGRIMGNVRGNNESTKGRFNYSTKEQKVFVNLDFIIL